MAKKPKKTARLTRKRRGAKPRKPKAIGTRAPKGRGLLERERRFVEHYMGRCEGNATEAAIAAGYGKKGAAVQGTRLLRKAKIQAALEDRFKNDPLVADRKELQEYWTRLMRGTGKVTRTKDRIRASELLGKTHGMFSTSHKIDVGDDLATLLGKPIPDYARKWQTNKGGKDD